MKKFISLFIIIATAEIVTAQAPVTDAAANAQLINLNAQLATLNSSIGQLNTTSVSNRVENESSKLISKDQFDIQDLAEKALWKVPQYLKQGKEINTILDKEANIIKMINNLNSTVNSGNIPNEIRASFMAKAYKLLNGAGSLVDTGLNILSDDSVRMEPEQRRNYLKDVITGLNSVESILANLVTSANSYKYSVEMSNSYKNNAEKALNKLKGY